MKNSSPIARQNFTFDELSLLAVTDPAKFEELRIELIERVINIPGGNPGQLAALQSRLDEAVDTGTPSYLACLHLSEWLNEPYQQLAQQLTAIDCNNKKTLEINI